MPRVIKTVHRARRLFTGLRRVAKLPKRHTGIPPRHIGCGLRSRCHLRNYTFQSGTKNCTNPTCFTLEFFHAL